MIDPFIIILLVYSLVYLFLCLMLVLGQLPHPVQKGRVLLEQVRLN